MFNTDRLLQPWPLSLFRVVQRPKPISGSRTGSATSPYGPLRRMGILQGKGWNPIGPMAALGTQSTLAAPICPMGMGLLIGQCTCGASPSRAHGSDAGGLVGKRACSNSGLLPG